MTITLGRRTALGAALTGALPASAQPRLAQDQTARFAVGVDDIRTLDPHISIGIGEQPIVGPVYESLVLFPDGQITGENLRPGLAERWESSPDKRVWTFHLRRGVEWHHGNGPFTAGDVVFSLARVRDAAVGSPFRSTLGEIEQVRALDPQTVGITLAHPDPNFPALMVNYQAGLLVSKRAVDAGVDLRTRPIGTGPFQAHEYRPRESYTLVRNDHYWGERPVLDRLVIQFMSDASTRELALRGGELHGIELPARQDAVDRMRRARLAVDLTAPANTFTIHLNMTQRPLDDLRIRRALQHATNREELLTFLGRDVSRPEWSPLPEGYVGHATDLPRYPFDLARARALLSEAGHPNGFNLTVSVSNNAIYLPPMQVIQEQWKRINVNLDLRVVDHPTYHRLIRENTVPVVIYGAFRYPLTGTAYLDQFYHSSAIVGRPTAVTNFSHYGGVIPGIDAEIDAARFESNLDRQRQLWVQAQHKIMTDAVAIPLFTRAYAMARTPKIELGHEQKSWSMYTVSPRTRILR